MFVSIVFFLSLCSDLLEDVACICLDEIYSDEVYDCFFVVSVGVFVFCCYLAFMVVVLYEVVVMEYDGLLVMVLVITYGLLKWMVLF